MKERYSQAFCIEADYDSISEPEVFKKLLKVLMVYAHKVIGGSTLRLAKNKADLAYDFAIDSIKAYIENPEKFDSSRNPDLVYYLKYNILRRLVSNFKASSGQKNEVIYDNNDHIDLTVKNAFVESNEIHDLIDLDQTLQLISNELEEDNVLKELFELRYLNEYKPKEIQEELNISKQEYNNRIRRLDTVRNRVLKIKKLTRYE